MLVGNASRKDILKTQKQVLMSEGRLLRRQEGMEKEQRRNQLCRSKCLFQAEGKTATDVQT